MRARLTVAAMVVFSERGVEASVIDDITTLAGVSRGTFYNYFQSNEEVLRAVAIAMGEELMQIVIPLVEAQDDPAERVATGVRSWLRLIGDNPQLARFFRRAGLYVLEADTQIRRDLPRDLIAGMQAGRFTIDKLELGFVLVSGTVLATINTLVQGPLFPNMEDEVAERILLSLGVDAEESRRIAHMPLARLTFGPDTLTMQAQALVAPPTG